MFDIGWTELMLIGIVALIVIGPKDLPNMFRTLGQFVGKARRMAREFQRSMEEAADEAGVSEATKGFANLKKGDPLGLNAIKDTNKKYTESILATREAKIAERAQKDGSNAVAAKPAAAGNAPTVPSTAPSSMTTPAAPEVMPIKAKPKAATEATTSKAPKAKPAKPKTDMDAPKPLSKKPAAAKAAAKPKTAPKTPPAASGETK